MKFYLALFFLLFISPFFPFLLIYVAAVLRSCCSFFPSRTSSDRLYLWLSTSLSAVVALALERPRHEKFHNYQSIKRGRGWTDVVEFYEKSREKENRVGSGRSQMEPH
jgi:hypothetical protein